MKLFEMFKKKSVRVKQRNFPTYGEVMTTLTNKELHDAFIAIEVLDKTLYESIPYNNASRLLTSMASRYNWHFGNFIDIVHEEYITLNFK